MIQCEEMCALESVRCGRFLVLAVPFPSTRMASFYKAQREATGPETLWPSILTIVPGWLLNHRFNSSKFSSEKWDNSTSHTRLVGGLINIMTTKGM